MNAIDAQQYPDEELVRRLAQGQHQALDPLHERYGPVLTNLAARQLDRPAAEEIVQDVFLTVWQHAGSFDPRRGSFRPWVFQITRRRIMNELRHRRSRPRVEPDPEGVLLDGLEDDAPDVVDKVASNERRSAVRGALEILPQPQREAVVLAFLNELTHAEVASALRVPLGTTKTRIRTGLLKLRVELMALAPSSSIRSGNPATMAAALQLLTKSKGRERECSSHLVTWVSSRQAVSRLAVLAPLPARPARGAR